VIRPNEYDAAEFMAALEDHAPAEYAGLRSIAKGPAADDAAEVAARLERWGIDAAWLREALLGWIPDVREWGARVGRPNPIGLERRHGAVLSLSWEPSEGESFKAFHARAARMLKAYERHVMTWARANGVARAYERRRGLPVGRDRWKPLILYSVRGFSIDRIAQQHGLDGPEAARKAVKALANHLGLTVSLRRRRADRN
jgi:hypothetical protein